MLKPVIELPGRGSRADELFDYLRSAILSGKIGPSERLVEEAVAQSANMSRTPVREAFQRLELAGLATATPRGLEVKGYSTEEMMELCAVRESLEGLASRLAAAHRSGYHVDSLTQILEATEKATDAQDVNAWIELNGVFHDTIWQASRNRYLARQLGDMRALIARLQQTTLQFPERQRQALAEHRAIAEAISAKDEPAAEAAMRIHIGNGSALRLARNVNLAIAEAKLGL